MLAPSPARWSVVVGSVLAVAVLAGGADPESSELQLRLVGLASLTLVVLAATVAWGRTLLVWVGVPMLLPAVLSAVALLGPPEEGIVLPFLVTTPTACGWAIFAFAAWNRVVWSPLPERSGQPSTERGCDAVDDPPPPGGKG